MPSFYGPARYELIIDDGGQECRTYYRTRQEALAAWERCTRRNDVFTARVWQRDVPYGSAEVIADHASE